MQNSIATVARMDVLKINEVPGTAYQRIQEPFSLMYIIMILANIDLNKVMICQISQKMTKSGTLVMQINFCDWIRVKFWV